jgi:hypothetical protein
MGAPLDSGATTIPAGGWQGRGGQSFWVVNYVTNEFQIDIVVYLLKAKIVEPKKQPLLAKGTETTFVSRQRLRNRQGNDVRC